MEQNFQKGETRPINGSLHEIVNLGLAAALPFFLLRKSHKRPKHISQVITTAWLMYSIYYQDFPVMVLCIIILIYSLRQS